MADCVADVDSAVMDVLQSAVPVAKKAPMKKVPKRKTI
jgi:hypothetical protein